MLSIKANLLIILFFCTLNHGICAKFVDVDIGIVLDMESWAGKSIYSCIMMAISDFYADNGSYRTRIVVHKRDSKGDRVEAMSTVMDLVNTVKVDAIIGPETYIGSELLGSIATKAKVPIFSFAGKPLVQYPYMFQIKEDELLMAKSIVTIVESYKWRDVIFMQDEAHHGSEILQYLFELFQDKNTRISYKSVISTSTKNDQITEELHKIMSFHTSIIIVDVSPSLASRLFQNAKRLGMMSKEYAWILTQNTIDILQSTNFEVIESLQGTLGFRSYIPSSRRLHNLTKRWNKNFSRKMPAVAI